MHLSCLFICLAKTDLSEQSIGRERIFFSSLYLCIYVSISLARSLARALSLCLSLTRAFSLLFALSLSLSLSLSPPQWLRPTKRVARECTPLLMHEDQKVLRGRPPLRMSEASDSRETKGRGRGWEAERVYWDRYSITGGAMASPAP